jgi:hypothetical protein
MYVFVSVKPQCLVWEVFCLIIPKTFYELIEFNGRVKKLQKFFVAICRGNYVFTVVYIVWGKFNFRNFTNS